jgi:hypothetical protein
MNSYNLKEILQSHRHWLNQEPGGHKANLCGADLFGVNLCGANLRGANLRGANLREANLRGADLRGADLSGVNLCGANLRGANLRGADLSGADLSGVNLFGVNLREANLSEANLSGADLSGADLSGATLSGATLSGAKGLVKIMGVEPGNLYWKRFDRNLKNFNYQFFVGLNTLRKSEVFASDARETCSYPGFHFASRSWCALNYQDRRLEARIRIPEDAQINEPWATDGKASASAIEILQVFDVATGKDVTDQFRRPE